MKFQPGDIVTVKSRNWYNENKDTDGVVRWEYGEDGTSRFDYRQERFCGKQVEITSCSDSRAYYNIKGSSVRWYVWHFEDQISFNEPTEREALMLTGKVYKYADKYVPKPHEKYSDLTMEKVRQIWTMLARNHAELVSQSQAQNVTTTTVPNTPTEQRVRRQRRSFRDFADISNTSLNAGTTVTTNNHNPFYMTFDQNWYVNPFDDYVSIFDDE